MARKISANNDARFKFTASSISSAACPPGKSQALYWDSEQRGLGLRVTPSGKASYIFEGTLAGKTVRVTIGPSSMPLTGAKDKQGRPLVKGARTEAARLAAMLAGGIDPRVEKANTIALQTAQRAAAKVERARREVTGLDAWADYCADRRPRWGDRHYRDHLSMAAAGGAPRLRAKETVTKPGPLRGLLARPLADIDDQSVADWVKRESLTRPARAALGFRLLRGFMNWCAEHSTYRAIAPRDACTGRKVRENLVKPAVKNDVLQREQLRPWFAEIAKLTPTTSAYLQCLLLTGARREELLSLRWTDVDFQWGSLRIRDKVEGERTIPLTPYVARLLRGLKARNETPPQPPRRLRRTPGDAEQFLEAWTPSAWVFASTRAADGRLQEPRIAHNQGVEAAGLPHLTLHGLRRSFSTLAEWVECPEGIVAQIQGHKPSAVAEKHYKRRPLDLLRLWHTRIEDWILAEACIVGATPETREGPDLKLIAGAGA